MSRLTTTKAIVQAIILSGLILSCTVINAQSEIPRISFVDPYWVSLNGHIPGSGSTTFDDYNYYWPQMDSCGFTHTVTYGSGTSFGNPANLYLLNTNVGNPWRYAKGVENDYSVGGENSYFELGETGKDIQDGPGGPYVFRVLCDSNTAGIVFQDSFPGWHQFMPREYWFTFTMKMDGDTSAIDPIAEIHIWEELEQSKDDIGHLNGLLWEDLWDISGPPKADRIDTVYSTDFKHPGEYELVELNSIGLIAHDDSSHKQYETHIEFKWLGTRDLYIDNLNVCDVYNYRLFVAPDSSDWYNYIQNALQAKHNLSGGYPERDFRFYQDEPHVNMYRSYAKVDILSKEKPGVPVNGATACDPPKRDPAVFAQMIDSDELLFNFYTIKPWTDSASTASLDTFSLQYAWDYLINVDSSKRKGMRYTTEACTTWGKDFWMTIQACAEYYPATGYWRYRAPTPNELQAEANLALCYGAKGIMYYLYPSFEANDGWRVHGLVDIVDDQGQPTWTLNAESRYAPNERWYAAQDINAKIDSLSDVLLSLNWLDAFVSHPNTIASHATFVESLYSDEFGTDTSYVEIGIFEHDDGTDYLMLVNRRCLSTESQTVTVKIDTATNDFYMLHDVYNHDIFGGEDGFFAGITLDPGEGRLFKLVDSDETWTGSINVQSSVTIPQSVQLTIEPAAVIKFAPGSKLHVNGVLCAKGSESQYISFTASDQANPWSGILFSDSSEDSLCVMKKCFIGYASTGIAFAGASTDTIDSILFHQCGIGISCENASPHITSPTIYTAGTVPIGIYCAGNSAPSIDSVDLSGNGSEYSKGIYIYGSDPVIRSGTISNFARGINICGGNPDIRYVELSENTECAIACNWSEDQPPESECDPCSAYIAYNDLLFNHIGIKSVNASPTVFYNRIVQNDSFGVFCSGTDLPIIGDLSNADSTDDGYNEIFGNLVFDVVNEASDTVQAEYNWWGQYPPDSSQFSGLVDYVPAMEESPDSTAPEAIADLSVDLLKVPSDSGIVLQWSEITTDVMGKLEFISHYTIYRDTIPGFVPASAQSLAVVSDTSFEYFDSGAVGDAGVNYYYVVKAVDYGANKSYASNRVGEFDRSLTEKGEGTEPPNPWD